MHHIQEKKGLWSLHSTQCIYKTWFDFLGGKLNTVKMVNFVLDWFWTTCSLLVFQHAIWAFLALVLYTIYTKPVRCRKTIWEIAWNSKKTSISQYKTTQHHLIITLDANVIETKFKQFWKELTFNFRMRPKTQFCILRHPAGFYRSYHN